MMPTLIHLYDDTRVCIIGTKAEFNYFGILYHDLIV